MNKFTKEFHTLNYVIKESQNILLFAHSRPDGDTSGSVMAFREYALNLGKKVEIACFDPIPEYLKNSIPNVFNFPAHIDLKKFGLIIACDSVERGFEKVMHEFTDKQVIALIDHHPDITIQKDINIIDAEYSSVCEIIYDFFTTCKITITKEMATYLMIGILSDTGMFQHSNTTPKILGIASNLLRKGAIISKIVKESFVNRNISTLRLWGRAFEKAKIIPENGMIVSFLSKKDMAQCNAGNDDIAQVASILNTVPGTKFSLVLSERDNGKIKGSLRSEEYKGVNVSEIASQFGGGGHKLASGFEIKGKIVETRDGWKIV